MKKNAMMRVASVMLVLVLMTSSVISGTFAKYTTQDSGKDNARVAKWGVELQVFGNLYGDTYDDLIVLNDDPNIAVQSSNKTDDVVAPGTKNTGKPFEVSLRGVPEVDGEITVDIKTQNIFLTTGEYGVMVPVNAGTVTEDNFDEMGELYYSNDSGVTYQKADAWVDAVDYYTLEDYVDLTFDYYPVVYTLEGNTKSYSDVTKDSLADVATAIYTQLGGAPTTSTDGSKITTSTKTVSFDSNTDLADKYKMDNLVLTWEWKFDQDGCALVGDNACVYSKADTILGSLMAGNLNVVMLEGGVYKAPTKYTHYCLDTLFDINIIVTQVD